MDIMRISWNPCDVAGWKVMLLGYCLKGWKTCHMDYSGAPQAIKTNSVQNYYYYNRLMASFPGQPG